MAVQGPGAGAGRVTITPPGIQSPTATDPGVTETEPKDDVADGGAADAHTPATSGPDYDDGDNTPPADGDEDEELDDVADDDPLGEMKDDGPPEHDDPTGLEDGTVSGSF